MKLAAMFGSSSGAIGATVIGAVVLIAGAIGITVFNRDEEPVAPVAVVAAEAPVEAPVDAAEVGPVANAPVAEITAPTLEAPRLDLVRVAPDGSTIIAGRTTPDLAIAILLDGVEVAVTQADGSGGFVAILSLPPSSSPRMLSVEARPEDGPVLAGVETILVAPFAGPVVEIAEVAEEIPAVEEIAEAVEETPVIEAVPAVEEIAGAVVEIVADAPVVEEIAEVVEETPVVEEVAEAAPVVEEVVVEEIAAATTTPAVTTPAITPGPVPTAPGALAAPALATATATAPPSVSAETRPASLPPARATAPAVVIASPEGLRVVQGPASEPAVQTSVRLDAISYNAEGAVILAGRGPISADIQVYLNNQPIQLGEIGPGGDWSLQLPDVDPGTYTLAVAELAEDGSTASRVETPFLREDPVRVVEAPVQTAAGIDVITVQPGFTLWGMAENTFGNGILYVQIFEENRDQIRDPHWIFPGQIFRMPDVAPVNTGN